MMDEQDREKISEILVSEERQIEIDTIRIMEENDIDDKEIAYKIIKEQLKNQRKRILSNR